MKIAIVYYSRHHGNTKKLIDAIAAQQEVTTVDAAQVRRADLSGFDAVGFASGIYFSKFHETVVEFARENLPEGMPVFFLYTCGTLRKGYTAAISQAAAQRKGRLLGEYGCRGYDTFGPFKLVGGIAKNHPSDQELTEATAFIQALPIQPK